MGEYFDQPTCSIGEHSGVRAPVHGQAWFMGDYLDQLTRSSSLEVRAPVYGRGGFARLMTSVKALLDMTHQQSPGFVMVTVGMVVGMVPLKATGKRISPVRSRILPLAILIKEDPAFGGKICPPVRFSEPPFVNFD